MKNPYQEKLKATAKLAHKNSRGDKFSNGLIVRHVYDNSKMNQLTWWDDVGFILNDYLVQVAWIHPRMAYRDRADDEAHKRVAHIDSGVDKLMSKTDPKYKKLGRSRKKVVTYSFKRSPESIAWIKALNAVYDEVIKTVDFQIRPYIKIEWVPYGRYVDICAPLEIRKEEDLMVLANLVRKLLKGETSLAQEFPNYVYQHEDWVAEQVTS